MRRPAAGAPAQAPGPYRWKDTGSCSRLNPDDVNDTMYNAVEERSGIPMRRQDDAAAQLDRHNQRPMAAHNILITARAISHVPLPPRRLVSGLSRSNLHRYLERFLISLYFFTYIEL